MESDAVEVLVGHLDADCPNWRDRIGQRAVDRLIDFVRTNPAEPDRAHYQALYTIDFIEEFDSVSPLLLDEVSEGRRWLVLEALISEWITADQVRRMAVIWNGNPNFNLGFVARFAGAHRLVRGSS